MKFTKPLIIINIIIISSIFALSHSQDEFIILDIEEGEMSLQDDKMNEEYQSAIKRQRMRKISSMDWNKKFIMFVESGIEHIIPKGLDHILFVLGLFFSSLLIGSLLKQVTAFTLAHSITLALAALDIISPPIDIIEPLIALSITWIAIENCLFTKPKKWRPIVVFTFGLLHGLGFASVLANFGLPKDDFVSLLIAFNIGVEIGQLLVIMAVGILFWKIRKKIWYRYFIQIPVSIIIALIGLIWFIQRVF